MYEIEVIILESDLFVDLFQVTSYSRTSRTTLSRHTPIIFTRSTLNVSEKIINRAIDHFVIAFSIL